MMTVELMLVKSLQYFYQFSVSSIIKVVYGHM